MPFETTCNDMQKRHVKVEPNGTLDGPIEYRVVSGKGTFDADEDGMGVYLISENDVMGNGPFDTVYEAKAMAGGQELKDTITLHVMNDTQQEPATNLGFHADVAEPK